MIRTLLLSACLLILAGCQSKQTLQANTMQPLTAIQQAERCLDSQSPSQCLASTFPKRCTAWVNASLKEPTYNLDKLVHCASTCQFAPALSRWVGACSSII